MRAEVGRGGQKWADKGRRGQKRADEGGMGKRQCRVETFSYCLGVKQKEK